MGGVVLIVVAAISFGLTVQCCKGCMLYIYMILLPVVLYSKYDVVVGVSDSLAAQHDKVIFFVRQTGSPSYFGSQILVDLITLTAT